MNLLGVTMGSSLQVFWQIAKHFKEDPISLYVSDSANYAKVLKTAPELSRVPTLKEWDLTAEARSSKPNMERLKALQAELPASLWHAALADRRLFFGALVKVRQDYRSRFTEDGMLAVLDVAAHRIDEFLEAQKPDMVLGFGTATFGDYLFEQLARRRGIPYGQLKATKISNYVALFDSGLGTSRVLGEAFESLATRPERLRKESSAFIEKVRAQGVKYEGTILFGRSVMLEKLRSAPRQLIGGLRKDLARRRDPVLRQDTHIPPSFPSAWYANVVQPLRTFRLGRRLPLLSPDDIGKIGSFAFYPMHFEPEVALQVNGRPHQNQIEVVRTLALSLPIGMKLLVKEHPRSLGFRKESYYRKLLDIPNVRLIDPFVPTIAIIRAAKLICVISGSVGLEAAIVGKPVLVLGQTPYTLLPSSMVQQARDLNHLDLQIRELLDNHAHDDLAIERLIAALISISVPINLYTKMLRKGGRYAEEDGSSVEEEYGRLADFLRSRLQATVS